MRITSPILTCQEKGLTTEVYDIVMEAFEKKTAAEWKEILTAADIPFALCQNWIEIRNDKQAEANNCSLRYDPIPMAIPEDWFVPRQV